MTDQIRSAEVEALIALARQPTALKAAEDRHVKSVADRQARLDRIKAQDAKAGIEWPRNQNAIAKAVTKLRDLERQMREANDELWVAKAADADASNLYTRSRAVEEAALIEGADVTAIERWKGDCLNELDALRRPGVIVTKQTVERNPVTRQEIRNGYSNMASIRARLDAVLASYREADELKLVADPRKLPTVIAEIRAGWPVVDQNPEPPKVVTK